jgi:hypothetical protein
MHVVFIFRQWSVLFIAAVLSSYPHSLITQVSDKPHHYVLGICGYRPTYNICLVILHCSGCSLLTASLRRRRMSINISVSTVAVPVNYEYTSEFREIFEATMYRPTNCILLVFFFSLKILFSFYQWFCPAVNLFFSSFRCSLFRIWIPSKLLSCTFFFHVLHSCFYKQLRLRGTTSSSKYFDRVLPFLCPLWEN